MRAGAMDNSCADNTSPELTSPAERRAFFAAVLRGRDQQVALLAAHAAPLRPPRYHDAFSSHCAVELTDADFFDAPRDCGLRGVSIE